MRLCLQHCTHLAFVLDREKNTTSTSISKMGKKYFSTSSCVLQKSKSSSIPGAAGWGWPRHHVWGHPPWGRRHHRHPSGDTGRRRDHSPGGHGHTRWRRWCPRLRSPRWWRRPRSSWHQPYSSGGSWRRRHAQGRSGAHRPPGCCCRRCHGPGSCLGCGGRSCGVAQPRPQCAQSNRGHRGASGTRHSRTHGDCFLPFCIKFLHELFIINLHIFPMFPASVVLLSTLSRVMCKICITVITIIAWHTFSDTEVTGNQAIL
mmetsp:Transcript_14757/g.21721  ORF Transcript_14757/g.21721 Transcript_14757/m.21721 type:complete len:259 (-) Transcript_14757:50-826(-)